MNDIPEGWSYSKLGDICDIVIGGTPSRTEPGYWDGGKNSSNLWVSIRDMNQNVISETAEHLSDLGVMKSNTKLIESGEVLMSFKLSIGKIAFAGKPLYTNEAICALIPKTDLIQRNYLFYALNEWDLYQDVDSAIKGSTLNKEKIVNIAAVLPPLHEQRKIAAILSSVDRSIETTERMIDKLEDLKKAMMQELLAHGLPPATAAKHGIPKSGKSKASPVGRIPEEWEVVRLGDVCFKIIGGGTPSRNVGKYYNGTIPWITVKDLTENERYKYNSKEHITKEAVNASATNLIPENKIVLATRMAIGKVFITGAPLAINQDMKALFLKDDVLVDYFYYWYLAQEALVDSLSAGSTVSGISLTSLRSMYLAKPSILEQKAIAAILSSIGTRTAKARQRRDKLQSLKKGLMQDLLTGRVRVGGIDL